MVRAEYKYIVFYSDHRSTPRPAAIYTAKTLRGKGLLWGQGFAKILGGKGFANNSCFFWKTCRRRLWFHW